MKLRLDTHLIPSWLDAGHLLPAAARDLIRDPANIAFVSALSLCDIWLEESLGKLRLPRDFETKMAEEACGDFVLLAL